jgi:hypothetical protein
MRWQFVNDPVVHAQLIRAEEVLEQARAFTARRALLRDARPPRRRARVWLGSVLITLGRRLLDPVAELPAPAAPTGMGP